MAGSSHPQIKRFILLISYYVALTSLRVTPPPIAFKCSKRLFSSFLSSSTLFTFFSFPQQVLIFIFIVFYCYNCTSLLSYLCLSSELFFPHIPTSIFFSVFILFFNFFSSLIYLPSFPFSSIAYIPLFPSIFFFRPSLHYFPSLIRYSFSSVFTHSLHLIFLFLFF